MNLQQPSHAVHFMGIDGLCHRCTLLKCTCQVDQFFIFVCHQIYVISEAQVLIGQPSVLTVLLNPSNTSVMMFSKKTFKMVDESKQSCLTPTYVVVNRV